MNMTILLALIIAWAALYVLKRVVAQRIVRKAGRCAVSNLVQPVAGQGSS